MLVSVCIWQQSEGEDGSQSSAAWSQWLYVWRDGTVSSRCTVCGQTCARVKVSRSWWGCSRSSTFHLPREFCIISSEFFVWQHMTYLYSSLKHTVLVLMLFHIKWYTLGKSRFVNDSVLIYWNLMTVVMDFCETTRWSKWFCHVYSSTRNTH